MPPTDPALAGGVAVHEQREELCVARVGLGNLTLFYIFVNIGINDT